MPARHGLEASDGELGAPPRQVDPQLLQLPHRRRGTAQVGQDLKYGFERREDIEQRERESAQHPDIVGRAPRKDEQQDTDGDEEEEVPPDGGGGEDIVADESVPADGVAGRDQLGGDERLPPQAVQLELFGAMDQAAEVREHLVHLFAQHPVVAPGDSHGEIVGHRSESHGDEHEEEHPPGEPAHIDDAGADGSQVQAEERDLGERRGQGRDVVGEGGQQTVGTDLLQAAQGGGEDLAAGLQARLEDRPCCQDVEQALRDQPAGGHDDAERDEAEQVGMIRLAGQDAADGREQPSDAEAADQAGQQGDRDRRPRQADVAGHPQQIGEQLGHFQSLVSLVNSMARCRAAGRAVRRRAS